MPAPATSPIRTRLFPFLFVLALLPLVVVAALFYVASVESVESVLQKQTMAVARTTVQRLESALPKLRAESSMPARGREVRTFFHLQDGGGADAATEDAARNLGLYANWFLERVQGRYVQMIYLNADGESLLKYDVEREIQDIQSAPSEAVPEVSDRQGRPGAGEKVRLSVVMTENKGAVLRFGWPVRAPQAARQPPGYVLVDAPLEQVLAQRVGEDVHLLLLDRQREELIYGADSLFLNQPEEDVALLQAALLQAARADSAGGLKVDIGEVGHVVAFVNLPQPAWTAVAVMPADPYTEDPRRTGQFNLIVTGLFALVAGLSIFFLVRRVQERTARLEAANLQIQEASRQKSAFLARTSHDLRTPMNAIIGYARILLRKSKTMLDPRQYRNLENIHLSASNLLTLINEILDLSKIEAGRMDVKPEAVDLQQLVAECALSVETLVKPGVRLQQNVDGVQSLRTDPEMLRRILMNLLGNAVKYTEAGSITISLQADADTVCLSVSDTGAGIPPDELPHIFDEYRQVDGTTQEGTGLGLTIVRKSVEMLGGNIAAESEVGKGTSFILRLSNYSP